MIIYPSGYITYAFTTPGMMLPAASRRHCSLAAYETSSYQNPLSTSFLRVFFAIGYRIYLCIFAGILVIVVGALSVIFSLTGYFFICSFRLVVNVMHSCDAWQVVQVLGFFGMYHIIMRVLDSLAVEFAEG